jgi:hypothetical protein
MLYHPPSSVFWRTMEDFIFLRDENSVSEPPQAENGEFGKAKPRTDACIEHGCSEKGRSPLSRRVYQHKHSNLFVTLLL